MSEIADPDFARALYHFVITTAIRNEKKFSQREFRHTAEHLDARAALAKLHRASGNARMYRHVKDHPPRQHMTPVHKRINIDWHFTAILGGEGEFYYNKATYIFHMDLHDRERRVQYQCGVQVDHHLNLMEIVSASNWAAFPNPRAYKRIRAFVISQNVLAQFNA